VALMVTATCPSRPGAIDISILSKKLSTQIAVFDTQTLRIDRFGMPPVGHGHGDQMRSGQ
jgi:hypothetical protein